MTFDPETLRRRLERDLETIRRYEELVARHGGKAPGPEPTVRPMGAKLSLAAITEQALGDEWRDVGYYHEQVRANGWPKSARPAVATALRRLFEKGKAEKRGDKSVGISFRRKQTA